MCSSESFQHENVFASVLTIVVFSDSKFSLILTFEVKYKHNKLNFLT